MYTFTKICTVLAILPLANLAANAQQAFDLSAQMIARPEWRRGYQTLPPPGADGAFFISQRTRLSAGFENERIKFGLAVQDVRVWGDESQAVDVPSFGLHEGWAEVILGKKASLKVGRQELVYDDQRLFSNNDWLGQARSHDAAVLKIKTGESTLHFGTAFNQTSAKLFGASDPADNYKMLGWAWYNRKFKQEKIGLSFYVVTDGFAADPSLSENKTYFRATAGPSLNFVSGKMSGNATLFGQVGKDNFDRTITAYFASACLDWAINGKLNTVIGYDYLSGNAPYSTPASENHVFNTLYGDNHKFYGNMDYFLDMYNDTKGGGLQDVFFKVKLKASSRTQLALDAHYFLLVTQVKLADGNLLDFPLGAELDFSTTHKINEFAKAQFGFSLMQGTASLEGLNKVSGGSADQIGSWGYLMLVVNPTLLKWEKE